MEREEHSYVKIGNTEYHIVSKYHGTISLEEILKRLIREKIEQGYLNKFDSTDDDS